MAKAGVSTAKQIAVSRQRPASDPATRSDGLCHCGCGKKRTMIAVMHDDPFASSECCKAFYNVKTFPVGQRGKPRKYA